MSKAVSCYWQISRYRALSLSEPTRTVKPTSAHVTQFSKSGDARPDSFVLKNSTVWGRREGHRTVSKTKASEMVSKSFSDAATVIQGKSFRIKKNNNIGQNHKLSYSEVPFSSTNIACPTTIISLPFQLTFLAQRSRFQSLCWEEIGCGYCCLTQCDSSTS